MFEIRRPRCLESLFFLNTLIDLFCINVLKKIHILRLTFILNNLWVCLWFVAVLNINISRNFIFFCLFIKSSRFYELILFINFVHLCILWSIIIDPYKSRSLKIGINSSHKGPIRDGVILRYKIFYKSCPYWRAIIYLICIFHF